MRECFLVCATEEIQRVMCSYSVSDKIMDSFNVYIVYESFIRFMVYLFYIINNNMSVFFNEYFHSSQNIRCGTEWESFIFGEFCFFNYSYIDDRFNPIQYIITISKR